VARGSRDCLGIGGGDLWVHVIIMVLSSKAAAFC